MRSYLSYELETSYVRVLHREKYRGGGGGGGDGGGSGRVLSLSSQSSILSFLFSQSSVLNPQSLILNPQFSVFFIQSKPKCTTVGSSKTSQLYYLLVNSM